jgi:hypothetical protein
MKAKKEPDPRHKIFKDLCFRCFRYLNPDGECPWDASDAKNLDNVLKANPTLTDDLFHRWLIYYSDSQNINPADRPRKFLVKITDYMSGPLNEYGRPLVQKRRIL